jgi:hypothetical protein
MMLTDKEKNLLNSIIEVMNGFKDIQEDAIKEGFIKYDGDNKELCYHIHALQNWVLANSVAREYPHKYRLFGVKFV